MKTMLALILLLAAATSGQSDQISTINRFDCQDGCVIITEAAQLAVPGGTYEVWAVGVSKEKKPAEFRAGYNAHLLRTKGLCLNGGGLVSQRRGQTALMPWLDGSLLLTPRVSLKGSLSGHLPLDGKTIDIFSNEISITLLVDKRSGLAIGSATTFSWKPGQPFQPQTGIKAEVKPFGIGLSYRHLFGKGGVDRFQASVIAVRL